MLQWSSLQVLDVGEEDEEEEEDEEKRTSAASPIEYRNELQEAVSESNLSSISTRLPLPLSVPRTKLMLPGEVFGASGKELRAAVSESNLSTLSSTYFGDVSTCSPCLKPKKTLKLPRVELQQRLAQISSNYRRHYPINDSIYGGETHRDVFPPP